MFLFNNFKLPCLNYYKNVLLTYYIKIYFVMSTDYNYGLKLELTILIEFVSLLHGTVSDPLFCS